MSSLCTFRRVRSSAITATAIALFAGLPSLVAAQAPQPPAAGLRSYTIDRAHSEINFTAPSRLMDAHGTFDKWSGDVQVDAAHLEQSVIRLTIDPASINTRVAMRDNHLRSPDFFDVAKFPQITFVSRSIQKTSDTAGTITGDLTLHGVTRQVAVPVAMSFYDGTRGRFHGSFPLDRKQWGVTGNSKMNPVEDVITVEFTINVVDQQGTR
ncbi:MAG TPA: YceI family protein [Candidatus Elarobacter sp.]|nr:YceI family protein [Candidatus Elarobacter sp.]